MPDFNSAKLTHDLTLEGDWPSAVAFVSDEQLVAGDRAGRLFLWDLARPPAEPTTEQKKDNDLKDRMPNVPPVRQLIGHTNGITRLLVADKDKTVVSSSYDRTIRVWDMTSASTGQASTVLDIEQRRRRIKRDKKKEQEILDEPGVTVDTQVAAHVLEGHRDWIEGCALSADGRRLLTGDASGVVILWDFPARQEIRRWTGHKMNGIVSTAIAPDGKTGFVAEHRMKRGDFDRPPAQAKLFKLDEGELIWDLLALKFPDVKNRDNSYEYGETWQKWVGHGFVAAAYSPDGRLLALGQGGEIGDAVVHLVEVETGKHIKSVSKHEYGVCDLKFTADGKHLLSVGRDTTLKIIRVEDGQQVVTLGKPRGGQFKDWLSSVALSPDETKLAATDIAGMVHIWQVS